MKPLQLTGRRFGRWTVLGEGAPVRTLSRQHRRLLCECDCGTLRDVEPGQLVNGRSSSCGCSRIVLAHPTWTGTAHYTIDPKGRLWLPVDLRAETVGLVAMPQGAVLIYPAERLPLLTTRWPGELTMTAQRMRVRAGRVLIPQHLRAWAKLTPGDDVAISGLGECAVVQLASAWDAHLAQVMAGLYRRWTRAVGVQV